MNLVLKSQATAAAAKVSPEVGLDPALIITLITTLLPILLNCFKQAEEPDPAKVKAAFERQYRKNPDKMRRQIRARVVAHSDVHLSKGQSLALADAIIAQVLSTPEQTAMAACLGD